MQLLDALLLELREHLLVRQVVVDLDLVLDVADVAVLCLRRLQTRSLGMRVEKGCAMAARIGSK